MRSGFWWTPNLLDFEITSERSRKYNCFAWALGDSSRRFDPTNRRYWPEGLPLEHTVAAMLELFRAAGYELCDDGSLEAEYEKVAIYAHDDKPQHTARQLLNGRWTSKLGDFEDIEHATPEELEGDGRYEYGRIVAFMRRPRV